MNFLYGRNGTPVGTRDGKWLFDELGKAIGSIYENYVFSPGGHGKVGRFLGDILYDNAARFMRLTPQQMQVQQSGSLCPLFTRCGDWRLRSAVDPKRTLRKPRIHL